MKTITFLRMRKILIFGCREFKDAKINIELSQICLAQLWLCPKTCQNQRLVIQGSGKMTIFLQSRLFW